VKLDAIPHSPDAQLIIRAIDPALATPAAG
jgi:hypothetical protein